MICTQLGMSWEFLHHGIPFNTIQKILIDFPRYDYDNKEEKEIGEIKEQSPAEFAKMMNNFRL